MSDEQDRAAALFFWSGALARMQEKPHKGSRAGIARNGVSMKAAIAPTGFIPVLPLRDVVVYPNMVIPLFVGRDRSMKALDMAMEGDKQIVLLAQKSPDIDDPVADDLYTVGTIATIIQLLKLPDGTIKVLVEGVRRGAA
jgi:ATP-dependent Lon protease